MEIHIYESLYDGDIHFNLKWFFESHNFNQVEF